LCLLTSAQRRRCQAGRGRPPSGGMGIDMAWLWEDRLAEVWAVPGKAGCGVAVGGSGVLTAHHVIAGAVKPLGEVDRPAAARVLARVVRPDSPTPGWVPMRVVADVAEWGLAVLEVDRSRLETTAWVTPASRSPVVVAVGGAAERDCEAVGFPDAEVQHLQRENLDAVVRQSEQIVGWLLPMGQAKPVAPSVALPQRWMPLDASTATPVDLRGWRGMSGAGVVLPDGRLAGIVVAAEHGHQQRRLYVVPLATALARSATLAATLNDVVGVPVVAEARLAPAYRQVLYSESLRADGSPKQLDEITDVGMFGVKPVDLAGGPTYLDYVPRDDDGDLAEALAEAAATRRMLLVVGDSGAGKSRSAAKAAQDAFATHRLLRPIEGRLAELSAALPLGDLKPAVVWLDGVERYPHLGSRATLQGLLDGGMVVIGTIGREEFRRLTAPGEIHDPVGEVLNDAQLVRPINWKREWSQAERDRAAGYITDPLALQAVAAGLPLGVWAVAGPQLVTRLADARSDEDYPCRFALVRAVLDWSRTGRTTCVPQSVAIGLINYAYLDRPASDDDIAEAIQWCTAVIGIGGRRGRYSMLTRNPDQCLGVNEYVLDHIDRHYPLPIPDHTWAAALANATEVEALSIALSAHRRAVPTVAEQAWRAVLVGGHPERAPIAAYNLGVLFHERGELQQAERWWRRAAQVGFPHAEHNLGLLLKQQGNLREAEQWWRRAAEGGHRDAGFALGLLLEERGDLQEAERWWRRAAQAGLPEAQYNLGLLLEEGGNLQESEHWLRLAAQADVRQASTELTRLWEKLRWVQAAEQWYRLTATAGDHQAAFELGAMYLRRGDLREAEQWLRLAAEAGHHPAEFFVGVLLAQRDELQEAEQWWRRAAEGGHRDAECALGLMLEERGELQEAERWLRRAAEAGIPEAQTKLGMLLKQRGSLQEAEQWYQRAAESGHHEAEHNLGVLFKERGDLQEAEHWWRRAAEAGIPEAQYSLGLLFKERGDLQEAEHWFRRAAATGYHAAEFVLGVLLLREQEDLQEAEHWFRRAAESGDHNAEFFLGALLAQRGERREGERWLRRAAEAGHSEAAALLDMLLEERERRGEDL
jgi:TPR repeat protein